MRPHHEEERDRLRVPGHQAKVLQDPLAGGAEIELKFRDEKHTVWHFVIFFKKKVQLNYLYAEYHGCRGQLQCQVDVDGGGEIWGGS